ncbi:MAG: histone deacetylase [Opitutaceae bacterium]|nr:histone deacetylase [Verrucomicrobiales bacterium]
MNVITDARCLDYSAAKHPERPERISKTVELLKAQKDFPITWHEPLAVEDKAILIAHDEAHLNHVRTATEAFGNDTPAYKDIADHARRSVGAGLKALRLARAGKLSFSLMRPPGHHATRNHAMGFCFFNNVAIAALTAQRFGMRRVAVFDFDVHHGNGTEAILKGRPNVLFLSVHQFPAYPGTGAESEDNCLNFPVPPHSPSEMYRAECTAALKALKKFRPNMVLVSAGFDAYKRDPLCQQNLEPKDFHWLGGEIRSLGLPVASLLEGGYSDALPELIHAYLKGLSGH